MTWFALNYPKVNSLLCSGAELTDQSLLILPKIKKLTLKETPEVTFQGILAYLKNTISLEVFQLYRELSDEQVKKLKALSWKINIHNKNYLQVSHSRQAFKGLKENSR